MSSSWTFTSTDKGPTSEYCSPMTLMIWTWSSRPISIQAAIISQVLTGHRALTTRWPLKPLKTSLRPSSYRNGKVKHLCSSIEFPQWDGRWHFSRRPSVFHVSPTSLGVKAGCLTLVVDRPSRGPWYAAVGSFLKIFATPLLFVNS